VTDSGVQGQVVLVRGDDATLVADAARATVAGLVGSLDPAMAVEEHGAGADDIDVGAVVDALATPPFLVDRRVVVVREAGRLVAAEAARLVSWINAAVPGVWLVLVGGGGTVPAALVKAVTARGTVVDVSVGTGASRQRWFAEQVRRLPVRFDAAATAKLQKHLGDDMGRLPAAVAPLVDAFGPGATITADDLDAFLGEPGSVAPWLLTDAIDAGDSAGALQILRRLLGPGGFHPLAVLILLHRHYQTMLQLDGLVAASAEDAAALIGARSVFPVKKAMAQGRRLGSDAVGRAILLLSDADLQLRGTSAIEGPALMEVLVGRLSRLKPGRRTPAAQRAR